MTRSLRVNRIVALICVFAVLLSCLPMLSKTAKAAASDYGKIIMKDVKLRLSNSTSADYLFKMPINWIVEIKGTTGSGSDMWYKVSAKEPDEEFEREGYVLGTCLAPLSQAGYDAWIAAGKPDQGDYKTAETTDNSTATPEATVTQTTNATSTATATTAPVDTNASGAGQTNAKKVNMRKSIDGDLLVQIMDKGTQITVLDSSTKNGKVWYKVQYGNLTGYILADYVTVTGAVPVVTAAPTVAPTAVPGAIGYVKLILTSANLRKAPEGAREDEWVPGDGLVMPYIAQPTVKGSYTWYNIRFTDGKTYFVRSDTVTVCDVNGNIGGAAEEETQTPATTIPSTTAPVTTTGTSGVGSIRLTKDEVNFRKTPGGSVISRLSKGTEMVYTSVKTSGGYTWYHVSTSSKVEGYVRNDCCEVISGSVATIPPNATATAGTYGTFTLTMDKVMFRAKPAGAYIDKLSKGIVLPVTAAPTTSGSYTWYPVTANGKSGYVRGDTGIYSGSGNGGTVTQAPATGNYVMITNNAVNVRISAGGKVNGRVDKNEIYPMTGSTVSQGGYTWYPIKASVTGYVRGDMCQQLTDSQVNDYLNNNPITSATPAPTSSVTTNYVITTLDKVNLRTSATKDSTAAENVALGTVMSYSTTQIVGGSTWYKVVYNNQSLWILGTCVKVMTQDEYDAWLANNPSATTPAPSTVTGYVKLTASGVNVRKTQGGQVLGRVDKGTILPYEGTPTVVKSITWYYCKTTYGYGYIDGSYLENCDSGGNVIATPTPAPTDNSGTKPEASYSTLKVGSTGSAVKALVTELKAQGYFTGAITSTYTSSVEAAIRTFQKDKGLSVDGIAGPNTQHALFGTVPIGTNGTGSFTMYACEKIDWYTGGIQTLWAKGKNAVMKDVKTGVVVGVHRWSGGMHADVEPLTAADTARMCQIYGVSSAEQITSSKHWQRRPIWVTIGGRTFAASMYGVPHNYPDGDTIASNNFKGQFCIHFVNSKTHGSQRVDSDHQAAIEQAYQAAPSRK